jgi:hypothetical protein
MHIKSVILGAALAGSMLVASAANATVVFSNGVDGDFWGGNNPFTYEVVTQPFTLDNATTFNSITYNAYTVSGDTAPVTNVFVELLNSSNNIVLLGNYQVASTAVIGGDGYYQFTDYTVNLPTVSLAAGQFALGLQVSPTQWNEHWSIPNGNLANGSDGLPHYFRLESVTTGVPEPGAWALMLAGFAGLGFVGYRRNKLASVSA